MADEEKDNIEPTDDAEAQDRTPEPQADDQPADGPSPEEAVEAAAAAAGDVEEASDGAPSDEADDILAAAKAAVAEAASLAGADDPSSLVDEAKAEAAQQDAEAATERVATFDLPSFADASAGDEPKGIDLLSDVNLNVSIELGRTRMNVEDVLKLSEGAVVELDKLAGDPVDVYVNDRLVARGEVLVLNDTFCIRINEIIRQGADLIAEAS